MRHLSKFHLGLLGALLACSTPKHQTPTATRSIAEADQTASNSETLDINVTKLTR